MVIFCAVMFSLHPQLLCFPQSMFLFPFVNFFYDLKPFNPVWYSGLWLSSLLLLCWCYAVFSASSTQDAQSSCSAVQSMDSGMADCSVFFISSHMVHVDLEKEVVLRFSGLLSPFYFFSWTSVGFASGFLLSSFTGAPPYSVYSVGAFCRVIKCSAFNCFSLAL